MNPRMFFDHFEHLADAPDAIPKLRAMILQLAVQGKLVPQKPDDEPASVLLEKIAAEKELLIREGKIRKTEPLPPIKADEIPYEVPGGWVWTRLGHAYDVRDGTHDTPKYVKEGFPLVTSKNIYSGRLDLTSVKHISEKDHRAICIRSGVSKGDVLFAMIGSIGNPVIVDTATEFSIKNVALFKYFNVSLTQPRYLLLFLKHAAEGMKGSASGAVQSFVSLGFLRSYLIPIPPLPEQKRIVAKIDQLMALCDELEERKKRRDEARVNLNAACLHELTSPESEKSRKAWKRIQSDFDLLYDTPANVAALRKSILQLAVMGRLAPQDPSDEPASVLLEKIAAEKERLIKEGKIKKGKPLPPIRPDEVPYEVPEGWEWAMLGDLGITQTGTTPSKSRPEYFGNYIPFIKPADITQNGIFYGNEGLSIRGMEKGRLIEKNSVLMVCIGGSIGKANLTDRDCSCNQQINAITPYSCISYEFLHFLMRSPYFQNEVLTRAPKSTLPILSKSKWERIPIAIPPLPEQQRIVAKVDRLMALCDQLEAQLAQSQRDCDALLSSIVNHIETVTQSSCQE